ncbi:SGNH/GDSL hydrolase family protein [Leptospira sp. 201903070]|uniref:SGNH/GDSL hydrolase family protein n=1 Tax=Leptospira ainlahdjerensis TaxID=2810033 RepID=A0ABS2UFT2_9LEPT|nr:SGNH/GDSL hydrolase family protein [Leptospira ainlahdjerensis]MBM9579024.1 SGNH/GDSL hydrolase family protein [Leptospira ainlahdjerensis]
MNRVFLPIISLLHLFLIGCDAGRKPSDTNLYLSLILEKPSLMLVGDSISAFWPAELLEPFAASKTAFPNRSTAAILEAAKNLQGRYRACTYNGGANDFLGNLGPANDSLLGNTIQRQKQAIEALKLKCDSIVVLSFWNVESPWPIAAVRQLNDRMKVEITDEFVLDPSSEITPDMLVDGGHLTYRGYERLSYLVKETFRLKGVLLQ